MRDDSARLSCWLSWPLAASGNGAAEALRCAGRLCTPRSAAGWLAHASAADPAHAAGACESVELSATQPLLVAPADAADARLRLAFRRGCGAAAPCVPSLPEDSAGDTPSGSSGRTARAALCTPMAPRWRVRLPGAERSLLGWNTVRGAAATWSCSASSLTSSGAGARWSTCRMRQCDAVVAVGTHGAAGAVWTEACARRRWPVSEDAVLGATLRAVLGTCRQLCGVSGAPLVLLQRSGMCGRRRAGSGDPARFCVGMCDAAGVCAQLAPSPPCASGVRRRCFGVGEPADVPERSSRGGGGVMEGCVWGSGVVTFAGHSEELRTRCAAKPECWMLPCLKIASMSR